jgi:hypothetical protein
MYSTFKEVTWFPLNVHQSDEHRERRLKDGRESHASNDRRSRECVREREREREREERQWGSEAYEISEDSIGVVAVK